MKQEKRDDKLVLADIKKTLEEIQFFNFHEKTPWDLERLAIKLRDYVAELLNSENEELRQKALNNVSAINHTIGKEVKHTEHYYNEMNKNNAAKKRKKEYWESVQKACKQLHLETLAISIWID